MSPVDGVVPEIGDLIRWRPGHRVRWYWIRRYLLRQSPTLLIIEDPVPARNGIYTVRKGKWERL